MRNLILIAMLLAWSPGVQAAQAAAAAALAEILASQGLEIIHSAALPDGGVEVLFGVEVTDAEYQRAVERLQSHPAIKGVDATTSPRTFCTVN